MLSTFPHRFSSLVRTSDFHAICIFPSNNVCPTLSTTDILDDWGELLGNFLHVEGLRILHKNKNPPGEHVR